MKPVHIDHSWRIRMSNVLTCRLVTDASHQSRGCYLAKAPERPIGSG